MQKILLRFCGKLEQYRLKDLLPQIQCPVLLLQVDPAAGGVLNDEYAELTASLLTDCEHLFLPGVSHSVHGDEPLRFSAFVSHFLEAL